MTVRTTTLGGTDWDDEQLTDTDLNDTMEKCATALVRKSNLHDETATGVNVGGLFTTLKKGTLSFTNSNNYLSHMSGSVEVTNAGGQSQGDFRFMVYHSAGSACVSSAEFNNDDLAYSTIKGYIRSVISPYNNTLFDMAGSCVFTFDMKNGTGSVATRGFDLDVYYLDWTALTGASVTFG